MKGFIPKTRVGQVVPATYRLAYEVDTHLPSLGEWKSESTYALQ